MQEENTTSIAHAHFSLTSFLPLNVRSQVASVHTIRHQGRCSISIFIRTNFWAGNRSVVGHLPSMTEALSSIPSIAKEKKKITNNI